MDEKYTSELKLRVQEASKLFKTGHLDKSVGLCYQILEKHPFQGHTLQLLGLIEINQGKVKEAIAHLNRSLTELKNDPIAHHNLASAYHLAGDREEAEKHDWMAVELNPNYVAAYFNLVTLTNIDHHLNIIKPIQRLLNESNLKEKEAAMLHFAAGKYFHHVKEYQRAYHHFHHGNRLQKVAFNPSLYHQQTQSIIQTFNRNFFKTFSEAGNTDIELTFLIGMPACGTNPLDTTLNKHAQIVSVGQNTDFLILAHQLDKIRPGNLTYPSCVTALTPENIKACAAVYLKHTPITNKNQIVLNSFPLNFNYIGLIKLLFPKAKFIHFQRHPLDTCLASFFNWLQNHYQFSHSLEHISQYYLDYLKLMQHWRGIFLEDILTIEFENFIEHTPSQLNKIFKFIGIDTKVNPNTSIEFDPRFHFETGFSQNYLTRIETLTNRLKPYIASYPTTKKNKSNEIRK